MGKKSKLQEFMEERIDDLRADAQKSIEVVDEYQRRAEEATREADGLQGIIEEAMSQGDDDESEGETPTVFGRSVA